MKRKRFIKLLMGKIGAERDAARDEATVTQLLQHRQELVNIQAKSLGYEWRMPMKGYAGRWQYYAELLERKRT